MTVQYNLNFIEIKFCSCQKDFWQRLLHFMSVIVRMILKNVFINFKLMIHWIWQVQWCIPRLQIYLLTYLILWLHNFHLLVCNWSCKVRNMVQPHTLYVKCGFKYPVSLVWEMAACLWGRIKLKRNLTRRFCHLIVVPWCRALSPLVGRNPGIMKWCGRYDQGRG